MPPQDASDGQNDMMRHASLGADDALDPADGAVPRHDGVALDRIRPSRLVGLTHGVVWMSLDRGHEDTFAGTREDGEGTVEDCARIASGFAHIGARIDQRRRAGPILAAWDDHGG